MTIEIMRELEEANFCMICEKYTIRVSKKTQQIPTPIVTSNAELTMKKAAELMMKVRSQQWQTSP